MLRDFTKDAFDIVIQAGQSNAQGTAFGDVPEPVAPDPRVFYLTEDFIIVPAREQAERNAVRGNFSLTFAADYLAAGLLAPGRNLLILRTAVGGTGFTEGHWTPEGRLYRRMQSMIRTALELNPENKLKCLLWHQGERDSKCRSTYAQHYAHLRRLVEDVRKEFSVPELPFLAGDLVQDWKRKNLAIAAPVMEATQAVCRDCAGAFVSSEGLLSNREACLRHPFGDSQDDLHFSRPAVYALGHRYFEAYQKICMESGD